MSDVLDLLTSQEATIIDLSIKNVRRAAKVARAELVFIGKCYNCEAPLDAGNFCDADCAEDYRDRHKAKQRNHGYRQYTESD